MEHPHAELSRNVRRVHEAIASADLDVMRELFASDVVWHVGGHGPLAADFQGVKAVLGLFGRIYDMADGTLAYDVHDVLADDEHAVVLLTVRATMAGRDIEDQAVHVCHLRDGLISEVWAFQWAQDVVDDAMTEVIARAGR